MNSMKSEYQPRPVVSQLKNNSSHWIGHLQTDPTDHFAGQTFHCPLDGELSNIQVFSAAVQNPGEMVLSIHSFDPNRREWGPQLASATVPIEKTDGDKWIRFDLPPMPLQENENYGFRLMAHNAMVAVGEAAAGVKHPFAGQEWHANSDDPRGHYYNYFSLAFKVEMCR